MAKKLQRIELHPDNLIEERRYLVEYRGEVASDLGFIEDCMFVKLSLVEITGRTRLAAQFLFKGGELPQAIAWYRIKGVTEVQGQVPPPKKPRPSKKNKTKDQED